VPWIIDYPIVVEHLRELKLRSVYFHGGAFRFADDVPTRSIGWIGPPDETITPEARDLARRVAEPYEQNLASLLLHAWRELLPGRIWVMPASHWAYELEFGSREWLPALLERIGVDPGMLQSRNTAAAIEFSREESSLLEQFVTRLLEMLQASDFTIAFPRRRVIAMLHHHRQIWWTSAEDEVSEGLNGLRTED
jgi:hypothetical protein